MGAIIELRFALCEGSQEDYRALLEDIGKAFNSQDSVLEQQYCWLRYEDDGYAFDLMEISRRHPSVGFRAVRDMYLDKDDLYPDRSVAWYQNGETYSEGLGYNMLSWPNAKEQMKNPSWLLRHIQHVGQAYDQLLGEVKRTVADGGRLDDSAYGLMYDEGDENLCLTEVRITEVRLDGDGNLLAFMERLDGAELGDGCFPDWFEVSRAMFGDFESTLLSIAEALLGRKTY